MLIATLTALYSYSILISCQPGAKAMLLLIQLQNTEGSDLNLIDKIEVKP